VRIVTLVALKMKKGEFEYDDDYCSKKTAEVFACKNINFIKNNRKKGEFR